MATLIPQRYPLLCGFREVIVCRGFLAGVEATLRALAEQEDAGWTLSGVHPGALAEGGQTLTEAVLNFRSRFKAVLADHAAEAVTFGEFQTEVMRFFSESDPETESQWNEAREAVRAGKVDVHGLQKVTAVGPPEIRIVQLELAPSANRVEKGPGVAA